jgi:4-hydroxy-2-oxoheptanedioate aldolase
MAEALGYSGYDFLIVDLQHGENNLADVQGMLQAISSTPAVPLVRVPANQAVYIQRALDLGAYGIVVPLVDNARDAESIVESVRYAPAGRRSWGPVRGALYGGADYFANAHAELLTIVMLETADGLANARSILGVPGIDGCFIGPNDLSVSLGFASELADLPVPVEQAIETIVAACAAAGTFAGIQTYSAAAASRRIAQGFRFVSIQSDLRMARSAATDILRAVREPATRANS